MQHIFAGVCLILYSHVDIEENHPGDGDCKYLKGIYAFKLNWYQLPSPNIPFHLGKAYVNMVNFGA